MKILAEKQELLKQLLGCLQVKGHPDVYVTFSIFVLSYNVLKQLLLNTTLI